MFLTDIKISLGKREKHNMKLEFLENNDLNILKLQESYEVVFRERKDGFLLIEIKMHL